MTDTQAAERPATPQDPHVIQRKDYRPPAWLVPEIHLDFDLDPARTRVRTRLNVVRNGDEPRPLVLDGDGLTARSVRVDGQAWPAGELVNGNLVLALSGDAHVVETEVEIVPEANTQLMGLYASSGMLCTQCEAEGFRRITFFPDRPDVLSRYSVRMTADAGRFPVLLSNGDKVGEGREGDRHWAEWRDPFPKPSYLFALVAGDLAVNRDSFTTMSGRQVELGIWVREADLPRTHHAMRALKASMRWDEEVYGREYDLAVFNIVAVDDFNFGAMENKGLNIFNSRYILADAETATDLDYDNVQGVVAHEYFHNWSGNRVTCRDWFQLSLKEGFTVFRDQQFSADMGSAGVKRIEDVRNLRAGQFPEDAGPLAHPVRPDSYIEIGNFYTATIYNKGAEVIRMLHTLLGPERFRAGSDLYFDRHDGEAATCDDFVAAMAEAGGTDLQQFKLWYAQAGTPRVTARLTHETATGTARLQLSQTVPPTPGQPDKAPMVLPLATALFDRQSGAKVAERLVVLDEGQAEVRFDGLTGPAVLSINRAFSAPVIMDAGQSADDLAFLSAHDDDPFARYEAMQQLMLNTLVAASRGEGDPRAVVDAVGATLAQAGRDPALAAETVLLPSEQLIGDQLAVVDPEAVFAAREGLRRAIATAHGTRWQALYDAHGDAPYEYTPAAKGARRLRNIALGYLMAADPAAGAALALRQFEGADNMTDRYAALQSLANSNAREREVALAAFYDRYRGDALVLDKWFTVQALSARDSALDEAIALTRHPDFSLKNPNRFRSVVGALSVNQRAFHRADGAGYAFLADQIVALDAVNAQTAAKMVPPLGRWRRFDQGRQALMRAGLQRLLDRAGVSKDVFEQASKSLAS